MTDMQDWINERRNIHNVATDGPWYKTPNDRILSESVQWPEGDDYDVAGGLGRDGAVVEAIHDFDGNAIADAHNTLPALLTAVEKVLELHQPKYLIRDGEWFPANCTVCEPWTWPCETVLAIEGASK